MIQSPLLRGTLVLCLLAFAGFCFWTAWTEPEHGPLVAVVLGLLALTFATGLVFPGRRRIALRVVAATVVLGYALYFWTELVSLLRGQSQPLQLGRPSATMAGLGLLLWGVPLLIYSFSGRTLKEHRVGEIVAADPTGALADRQVLDALAAAGADLERTTEVRFYLEFPSEAHARSAENVVQREGLHAEIIPPNADGHSAFCCVVQEIVPSWDNIRAARLRFEQVASTLGGTVDGWEAAVEK